MWYERYFREGHAFQLRDPEDEEDLNTYVKSLMEQGINYKQIFFTTGCGEDYVAIEKGNLVY